MPAIKLQYRRISRCATANVPAFAVGFPSLIVAIGRLEGKVGVGPCMGLDARVKLAIDECWCVTARVVYVSKFDYF